MPGRTVTGRQVIVGKWAPVICLTVPAVVLLASIPLVVALAAVSLATAYLAFVLTVLFVVLLAIDRVRSP